METDRELLAMAAKAAGIRVKFEAVHDCFWIEPGQGLVIDIWNPLQSDGDALRLAVKLKIDIHQRVVDPRVAAVAAMHSPKIEKCSAESERLTATRRAIVRAAAEIGRAMP